tara:strand:- start:4297 stop:5058 length:762 start_codon:yes stop_codon:yes gene_type:complete
MQVKVVTSGCSFTHAPDSWANWLEQRYELFNVAEGGGGNEMNIRNLMKAISNYKPNMAIMQISGIDRFEVVAKGKLEHESDHVVAKENYSWLKSTGNLDWVNDADSKISKPIKSYMKYNFHNVTQALRTLCSIVALQNYCKVNNVRLKLFCWQETFTDEYHAGVIKGREELEFWYNQVDWNQFWFHGQSGGLAEWGIDNNFTGNLLEDHLNKEPQGWTMINDKKTMIGHPSTECHKAFADKVVEHWIQDEEQN